MAHVPFRRRRILPERAARYSEGWKRMGDHAEISQSRSSIYVCMYVYPRDKEIPRRKDLSWLR